MGRKVKCQICGAELEQKDAYKVQKGNRNFYYCSKSEYDDFIQKELKRHELISCIYKTVCEIIGYSHISKSQFNKEKMLWNKYANDYTIYSFLQENKKKLSGLVDKVTKAEYNRIRYLSTVVSNQLPSYKIKLADQIIGSPVKDEHYETRYVHKKRKPLIEFEEDSVNE